MSIHTHTHINLSWINAGVCMMANRGDDQSQKSAKKIVSHICSTNLSGDLITGRGLIGSVDKGSVFTQVTWLGYYWHMVVSIIAQPYLLDQFFTTPERIRVLPSREQTFNKLWTNMKLTLIHFYNNCFYSGNIQRRLASLLQQISIWRVIII